MLLTGGERGNPDFASIPCKDGGKEGVSDEARGKRGKEKGSAGPVPGRGEPPRSKGV